MDPTRTPRRHHAFARLFQRLALGIAALLISGCAIEGGVPNIAATPSPAQLGLPPTAAALTPTPAPTSWTIGLLDQPRTLLPYQSTPGNARAAAPIREIVFPSPVPV
ncbi:hypothetical protein SE17_42645 [Kouleothrix aurantiaca]|uniref:Uncharacterized protein n=1 Tax=Kouleothrix aurantiaca TaxID=186479 RepID=A0A0P9CW72_9CHLR|nr:hypothetical protein SE17_42645 [Kouleothrix aurantiaca]